MKYVLPLGLLLLLTSCAGTSTPQEHSSLPSQDPSHALRMTEIWITTDLNAVGAYTIELLYDASKFQIQAIVPAKQNETSLEPISQPKSYTSGRTILTAYRTQDSSPILPLDAQRHLATVIWNQSRSDEPRPSLRLISLYDQNALPMTGICRLQSGGVQ